MKTYTIYKHTNSLNGKHYIGLTKYTMEHRWKQHVEVAKYSKNSRKALHNAIRKYGEAVFTHKVIVTGVPDYCKQAFEKYWINYYRSFHDGYNCTLGGDYFDGYIPEKGENHHSANLKIYTFYSTKGETFIGTHFEFCKYTGIATSTLNRLLSGKNRMCFTWTLDPTLCCSSVKPRVLKIKKHSFSKCMKLRNTTFTHDSPNRFTPLEILLWKSRLSEKYSGKGNPIYGTKRSQTVKDAVSKRRRNEADKTLRTWIHTSGLVETAITCLALRDKYPELNISKLNNIALKLKTKKGYLIGKSTKGWSIKNE